MDLHGIFDAAGLIAGVCVILAFILGYFSLKIKNRVKIHKIIGIIAFAAVLVHAGINMYLKFK